MSEDLTQKYPRACKFLRESGMDIDEALKFTEEKIKELEGEENVS